MSPKGVHAIHCVFVIKLLTGKNLEVCTHLCYMHVKAYSEKGSAGVQVIQIV